MKYLMLIALSIHALPSVAQFPTLSPEAFVSQRTGDLITSIRYERPAARGRVIFGGLVPYDKLWRTGAGNCTKITFTQTVVVGHQQVPAGTYALLTIPGKKTWTVILNRDSTLYGTDRYDTQKDVVRFTVNTEHTDRYHESLSFDIDVVPNDAAIYLAWENVQIHFTVETQVDKIALAFIQSQLLTRQSNNADLYAQAAEYLFYSNKQLEQGVTLVDRALQFGHELWFYRLKVDLLEKLKRYPEAKEAALQAIDAIKARKDWDDAEKKQNIQAINNRIESFTKARIE